MGALLLSVLTSAISVCERLRIPKAEKSGFRGLTAQPSAIHRQACDQGSGQRKYTTSSKFIAMMMELKPQPGVTPGKWWQVEMEATSDNGLWR